MALFGSKFSTHLRGLLFHSFYVISGRSTILTEVDRLDRLYHSTREQIETQTRRGLQGILGHALRTVPYYRDLGVRPLDDGREDTPIQELIARFPILTKHIIRKEGRRLWSGSPGRKIVHTSSGGSTGEPLPLVQDQRMRRCSTLNKLLFLRWLGYRPGELHLHVWGVPEQEFNERVGIRQRIYEWMHHQRYLSCFRMSEEQIDSWIDIVQRRRPSIIEAYVDAIYHVSRTILERGIQIESPRGIVTGAGVLTPQMREVIEQAFGCPILNRYGSREVADMACSCPCGPELHVSEQMYVLEIVDETGSPCQPGIEGDVLVTLLTNYTMPLIRYKIEDRASWADGDCKCGRATRRLVSVAGRSTDYLLASDGTRVNGVGLNHITFSTPGLRKFQFRQIDRQCVQLIVVPNACVSAKELRRNLDPTLNRITRLLGDVEIKVRIADEIDPSRSGKNRYVINDLLEAADGSGASELGT